MRTLEHVIAAVQRARFPNSYEAPAVFAGLVITEIIPLRLGAAWPVVQLLVRQSKAGDPHRSRSVGESPH